MDINTIRKVQEYLARKNQQQTITHARSIDELTAEAQAIDASKKYKRKSLTKEQKAEQELKLMQQYDALVKDIDDDKPKYTTIEKKPDQKWDVTINDKIEYFDPTLSYELTGYRPITATEGLDFDPKKFTEAADSYRKNGRYTMAPEGTFRNKQFWAEEWNRCCNGYKVGKYRLTGQNYFWLNYYRLQSNISAEAEEMTRVEDFPGFLAKQYEYFHYLELVKLLKKDGLIFKARGVNTCATVW